MDDSLNLYPYCPGCDKIVTLEYGETNCEDCGARYCQDCDELHDDYRDCENYSPRTIGERLARQ